MIRLNKSEIAMTLYNHRLRKIKFKLDKSFQERENLQNFVMKVYIGITSKIFADFRFESPISIDFQTEILALLRPKSAKTFHESLQILSPRKSARTFRMKVYADFQSENPGIHPSNNGKLLRR